MGADFERLLDEFSNRNVKFIVIGGVSAALQGVPATTFDLDLVLDPDSANLDRAFELLKDLDACMRQHLPSKRLIPIRTDLESRAAILLMTSLGPLDLLGRVATGWGFAELMQRSRVLSMGNGVDLYVLDLAALIEVKEMVGREKDLSVLPLYRQTLDERK